MKRGSYKKREHIPFKNKYEVEGDTTKIFIHSKKHGDFVTIIDTHNLQRVMDNFTSLSIDPLKSKSGRIHYYVKCMNRGKNAIHLQRFIANTPKGKVTDHKDRNPMNNLENNLIICTHQENLMNRTVEHGYPRGVHFNKNSQKFVIRLTFTKGKQEYFGSYDDVNEAIAVAEALLKARNAQQGR